MVSDIYIYIYFLLPLSGSDGLMKLWVIKSNTCVSTMDEHEDKVWSVTVNKEEDHIVTGGADSSIILWKVGSCDSRDQPTYGDN